MKFFSRPLSQQLPNHIGAIAPAGLAVAIHNADLNGVNLDADFRFALVAHGSDLSQDQYSQPRQQNENNHPIQHKDVGGALPTARAINRLNDDEKGRKEQKHRHGSDARGAGFAGALHVAGELADSLDAGVYCVAGPYLPKRGKRHPRHSGNLLDFGVAMLSKDVAKHIGGRDVIIKLMPSPKLTPTIHSSGRVGNSGRRICQFAYIKVVKALKPFTLVALGCHRCASINQRHFSGRAKANALDNMVFNKLNADARNAVGVLCNAGFWVDGSANFDVTVGEMADVEIFHLSHRLIFTLGFRLLAHAQNAVYALCNKWRELVRPLLYRLVSNAHRLGGGGNGAAQ